MGLFTGMSILSMFEIAFWIFRIIGGRLNDVKSGVERVSKTKVNAATRKPDTTNKKMTPMRAFK